MKKVLLLIISLYICFQAQAAFSYQTVLVDFPQGQGWHAAYYDTVGDETILQYTPVGQAYQGWTKSVIFHAYRAPDTDSASQFLNTITTQMELQNSSQMYTILKYTDEDAIATRCITKNANTPSQCEIYRVSTSFEGLISMHYINRNITDFKNTYNQWYQIMKDIRIYYSYYMDDRVMNKATSFEL